MGAWTKNISRVYERTIGVDVAAKSLNFEKNNMARSTKIAVDAKVAEDASSHRKKKTECNKERDA